MSLETEITPRHPQKPRGPYWPHQPESRFRVQHLPLWFDCISVARAAALPSRPAARKAVRRFWSGLDVSRRPNDRFGAAAASRSGPSSPGGKKSRDLVLAPFQGKLACRRGLL